LSRLKNNVEKSVNSENDLSVIVRWTELYDIAIVCLLFFFSFLFCLHGCYHFFWWIKICIWKSSFAKMKD